MKLCWQIVIERTQKKVGHTTQKKLGHLGLLNFDLELALGWRWNYHANQFQFQRPFPHCTAHVVRPWWMRFYTALGLLVQVTHLLELVKNCSLSDWCECRIARSTAVLSRSKILLFVVDRREKIWQRLLTMVVLTYLPQAHLLSFNGTVGANQSI